MYCVAFRNRYKRELTTINNHLHGHLYDCIVDFGPIYSFWCFSFKRYNGIFEHFQTYNRDVAAQLFRRFLTTQAVAERMSKYGHYDDLFWQGFSPVENAALPGTLGRIYSSEWITLQQIRNV